jgi:hypothetical protein
VVVKLIKVLTSLVRKVIECKITRFRTMAAQLRAAAYSAIQVKIDRLRIQARLGLLEETSPVRRIPLTTCIVHPILENLAIKETNL